MAVPGRGEAAPKARATARDQGGGRGRSAGVTVRGAASQPPSGSPPHGAHPRRLGLHTEGPQSGAAGGSVCFATWSARADMGVSWRDERVSAPVGGSETGCDGVGRGPVMGPGTLNLGGDRRRARRSSHRRWRSRGRRASGRKEGRPGYSPVRMSPVCPPVHLRVGFRVSV